MAFFKFRKKNKEHAQENATEIINSEVVAVENNCNETTPIEFSHDGIKAERVILPSDADAEDTHVLDTLVTEKKYEFPPKDLLATKASAEIKVPLSELINTEAYEQADETIIPVVIGKDILGEAVIANLVDMPHLLIVGVSDSGKSACLDSIITSILLRQSPDSVRLIIVNTSGAGLMSYRGVPHLLLEPVTDHTKVSSLFQWVTAEECSRYNKIQECGVRDFESYNAHVEKMDFLKDEQYRLNPLPRLVVAIDELGDILLRGDKDFEEIYQKAIQRGRGAGIHFVATTNPISGALGQRLYASFPSKVACALASSEDSKLAINIRGAERLLGRGDMLYYPMHQSAPTRAQGAFVTDDEIGALVRFLRGHSQGYFSSDNINNKSTKFSREDTYEDSPDRLLIDAGRLIIEKDKASIGMLQRVFRIGFNRAARIMDQLCEAGVVSEEEGTKPRKVLMDKMQFEEMVANKQQ